MGCRKSRCGNKTSKNQAMKISIESTDPATIDVNGHSVQKMTRKIALIILLSGSILGAAIYILIKV